VPLKTINLYAPNPRFVIEEAQLFLHEHQIYSPPVPIKELVKTLCPILYFYNYQDEAFYKELGFARLISGKHEIYINGDQLEGQDSFTYAHEAGHVICRHLDICSYGVPHSTLDIEANLFAATVLMPEPWVTKETYGVNITVQELGRLHTLFGVSWEAMINRLDSLGIQRKESSYGILEEWRNSRWQGTP
jgi:Zn-dependent peptidase ImmA (M78 family)